MHVTTLALAPLLIPQALWVAARAARLPEASGDRTGIVGSGPPLRLLVLGDSSAAGVGVSWQTDALGGRLSHALSERCTVTWTVLAKSGGTVRSTLRMLELQPPTQFDVVLVALGVNDAKNGVSLKNWTTGYDQLLDTLFDRFGAQCVCVSGLPPVQHFPILPRPLNRVLGDRFAVFGDYLHQIVQRRPGAVFLPFDLSLDVALMASDGFHPGPEIYREWARRAAFLFAQAGY